MKKSPGIFQKLTTIFVFFASGLLLLIGILAYLNQRSALLASTISELFAVSVEKQISLDFWRENRLEAVTAMAGVPDHAYEIQTLLFKPQSEAQAKSYLREHLMPWVATKKLFIKAFVVDAETGKVLVSTEEADEGKYMDDQPFFQNGRESPYIQSISVLLQTRIPTMLVSAPVRSADGQVLAILLGETNLNELNKLINRRSGLRRSDDSFLVNNAHLVVTPPRLKPDSAALRTAIHTPAVDACLQQESGSMLADDYRGIPAVIVYRWLSEEKLCVITKMDQSEAFAPSNDFGKTLLLAEGGVLAVCIGVAYVLARSFTQPILQLSEAANQFGQGKYRFSLPIKYQDEIGQLTATFQQMAESIARKDKLLQQHARTLEKRVAKRTEELSKINQSLRKEINIRKSAEEQIRFQADLLANVNDAVIATDENSHMTYYNKAAEMLFGWKKEEILGKVSQELMKTQYVGITRQEAMRILAEKGAWRGEITRLHKNGERIPLEVSNTAVKDEKGKLIGIIGVVRDISERKQAEEEIRALNASLELKVRERTAELQASNQELEAFAYSVSHDLRAPLRAMSGFSEALLSDYAKKVDEQGRHYLERIQKAAVDMGGLIEELLGLSRVTRKEMKIEEVDLSELAYITAEELRPQYPGLEMEMKIDKKMKVRADTSLMKIVMDNLLSNAVKFCSKKRQAKIHFGNMNQNEENVYFVRDNGAGFDMAYADKLFTPFQRLHSKEDYPGTGIGLASVKRIITRHGGRVWAEATLNNGATIYFTLGGDK